MSSHPVHNEDGDEGQKWSFELPLVGKQGVISGQLRCGSRPPGKSRPETLDDGTHLMRGRVDAKERR